MRIAAAAILLLVSAPQDELTLDQILAKMDEAAKAARGTSFAVRAPENGSQASWLLAASGSADVAVANDGTVRVRFDEGQGAVTMPGFSRSTPERIFVFDEKGLAVIQEWPARSAQAPLLRRRTERIAPSTDVDPFTESTLWGTPMATLSAVLLHALVPGRAFRYHPGLELIGRRRVGNEEFFVLISRRKLDADDMMMGRLEGVVRKFLVSATDFRLRRLEERLASTGGQQDYRMTWTLDDYDAGVPGRFSSTWSMDMYIDYSWTLSYRTADAKRAGIDGAALRPPADDLYATRARHAALDKLLEQSPDDADLNWSKAVALATASGAMNAMGRGQAVDPTEVIAAVEKALEKTWSPTLVRNLLVLYAQQSSNEKLGALVDRVLKDEKRTPAMSLDAAEALNALGRPDDALAVLEKLEGVPRLRIAEERIGAYAAKGDLAKATAEFVPLATPEWIARLKGIYDSLGDEAKKKIPPAEVLKALEGAIASAPASAVLHLTRLTLLEDGRDVDLLAAAIAEAWKHTTDPAVDEVASRILDAMLAPAAVPGAAPMMVVGGAPQKQAFDAAKVKASIKAVQTAVEAGGTRPAAQVHRAQALVIADDKEGAAKAFAEAVGILEKTPAADNHALAGRLAEALSVFGDEALLEKACRLALDRASKESLAADIMTGWNRTQSPLAVYAKLCMKNRKFVDLYRVMKGVDFAGFMGLPYFFMSLQIQDSKDFFTAAREEALKDEKDVSGLKWLAKQVQSSERFGAMQQTATGLDIGELYEKARERAPRDLEVLQSLAEHYARKNDKQKVFKACEEVVAALDAGATCDRPWSRARAWLNVAQQHSEADKIKEALGKIDLAKADLTAWELWSLCLLSEAQGQADRAVDALVRLEREGYRPYLKLAQLHQKAENWMEAMRAVNRALAFGYEKSIPRPGSIYDGGLRSLEADLQTKGDELPQKLRLEIFQKIGQDWFIDRLLESKLPALSAEDEKRAKEAFGRLSGDDLGDRDDANETLRKIGKGCAPILKPGLKSTDEEVRIRARMLLTEWAEPR